MRGRSAWRIAGLAAVLLAGGLMLAPDAWASGGATLAPAGLLGLPSLHSIIQAIAGGFFGALAGALVPSWLKHGSVATIQQLVALPDPGSWSHVSQLQGEMTYLGAMLLPVTLAVGAVRYWLVGLTGAAHPATALVRCTAVTGVLVAYRWIVQQTVAATNTLTHGILGLPAVAGGLQRIIGVLFGGALLTGTGGVFGAFLVIIGVVFAAGLFAAQVLMTVVLAVLIVAGPPLIAVSAIPELSHLARSWADTLLAVALVPLGWTILFATAGALSLDATSFTGASGRLPAHVAAAFAGLITFVIAVRLPLMLLGEIRHIFSRQTLKASTSGQQPNRMPGSERVRAAHARLRAVGLEGIPSLGHSAGRAASALGAPPGGPLGTARRGIAGAARRTGMVAGAGGSSANPATGRRRDVSGASRPRGVRSRLTHARKILTQAPHEALTAVRRSARQGTRVPAHPAGTTARNTAATATEGSASQRNERAGANSGRPSAAPAARASEAARAPNAPTRAAHANYARTGGRTPPPPAAALVPHGQGPPPTRNTGKPSTGTSSTPPPPRPPEMHPAGKPKPSPRRDTAPAPQTPAGATARPQPRQERRRPQTRKAPPPSPAPAGAKTPPHTPIAKRKPRPRGRP